MGKTRVKNCERTLFVRLERAVTKENYRGFKGKVSRIYDVRQSQVCEEGGEDGLKINARLGSWENI